MSLSEIVSMSTHYKRYIIWSGPMSRAGMGKDFVPGYPSLCYPRVPVTIAFCVCPQLENIHLNENNK